MGKMEELSGVGQAGELHPKELSHGIHSAKTSSFSM